jgi:hypothetical protein
MIRVFRAFMWMRFRIFVNSLERTGSRDALDRFSIAIEKLGPIMAIVLLVPSAIGFFVLGTAAGYGLATGSWSIILGMARGILLVATIIAVVSPMVLPSRGSAGIVRLLLLPIPRGLLYLAQAAGAFGDPWVLLTVPLLVGLAIGLTAGLKLVAAALALLAALAYLAFLTGVTSLASSIIHLLLRDRRRGDLVMVIMIFLLPLTAVLPQFLLRDTRGPDGRTLTRAERRALPPSPTATAALRLAPYVPSEMYRRTAATAVGAPAGAMIPLAELAGLALLVQAASYAAYRRVLDMPVSLGMRRAGAFGGLWDRVVPGLSAGASAVAFTQLRLALRSPRGRASMVTPLLMPLLFGAMASRYGGLAIPGLPGEHGLPLAAIGVFTSILALLPISMNQFAIDRAGFTRYMLAPISIRDLLTGKAVGNGLIAAIPASICFVLTALIFRGSQPLLWLGLIFGGIATYALLSPAAAALSAVFPKTVDLNSIGNSSNAHQAAGLLGMISFLAAGAPAALLSLFALIVLRRPELVTLLLLAWAAVAIGISYLLFIPVRRLVANRCETLAQY